MARLEKMQLGDLMVQQQLISPAQLAEALVMQKQSGRKLGRLLTEHGFATEDEISAILAHQLQLPVVDLDQLEARREVAMLLSEQTARRFRAAVVESRGDRFLVAMADPSDLYAYTHVRGDLGWDMEVAVASESSIGNFIDRAYAHP